MADTKRVAETAVSTKEASSPGVSKRRRIACSRNAHLPLSSTTDHYLECTPASDGDSCLGSSSDRLDDGRCCRSNAQNDVVDGGDDVDREESLQLVDLESPNSKTVGASSSATEPKPADEPSSKAAGEPAPANEPRTNDACESASGDEPGAPANDGGELHPGIAPLREELEEFFANAERYELRHFTEKYNFDFANDVPLEGRYEWHPLTP